MQAFLRLLDVHSCIQRSLTSRDAQWSVVDRDCQDAARLFSFLLKSQDRAVLATKLHNLGHWGWVIHEFGGDTAAYSTSKFAASTAVGRLQPVSRSLLLNVPPLPPLRCRA